MKMLWSDTRFTSTHSLGCFEILRKCFRESDDRKGRRLISKKSIWYSVFGKSRDIEHGIEHETGLRFIQQENNEADRSDTQEGKKPKFLLFWGRNIKKQHSKDMKSNAQVENKSKKDGLSALEQKIAKDSEEKKIVSRSAFERFAYSIVSSRLPKVPGYKEIYQQAGIPLVYESYLSTALLVSCIITLPTFLLSMLMEIRVLHLLFIYSFIGSTILSGVLFAISLQLWLFYPLQRRKAFKSRLDGQLAYSFGILGVLSASGMGIDRLFERLATSESNPVLAELSKRFLRDIRAYGLDTESALKDVAKHSPSLTFSKMLDSMAVAFRTTGSIHDLVLYESGRLLEEKREGLRKIVGNLSITAELYITLVVVGPIIFIVMMAIFSLLPAGGLPDPVLVIDLIVFIGVPVISIMFTLMLDSLVTKA